MQDVSYNSDIPICRQEENFFLAENRPKYKICLIIRFPRRDTLLPDTECSRLYEILSISLTIFEPVQINFVLQYTGRYSFRTLLNIINCELLLLLSLALMYKR
jgi:hypothetical protein